MNRIHAQIKSG